MRKIAVLLPLLLLVHLQSANGQLDACLDKVRPATDSVDLWKGVGRYFASLPQDKTVSERAQITQFRAVLVSLESAKMTILALVESRLAGNAQNTAAPSEISLRNVPDTLKEIGVFTTVLGQTAQEFGMFDLQPQLKKLKVPFDFRSTQAFCESEEKTPAPADKGALQSLLNDLRRELESIFSTEEQLIKFRRI